jgi:hypothetical protein
MAVMPTDPTIAGISPAGRVVSLLSGAAIWFAATPTASATAFVRG